MNYRKRVLRPLVNCINDIRLLTYGKHHKRPVNVVKTTQTAHEIEMFMSSNSMPLLFNVLSLIIKF